MTYRIDMDAKECEIAHYFQVRGIFINLKEYDIEIYFSYEEMSINIKNMPNLATLY